MGNGRKAWDTKTRAYLVLWRQFFATAVTELLQPTLLADQVDFIVSQKLRLVFQEFLLRRGHHESKDV